ncbi:MAG: hypothetical protein KAI67_01175 [Candidatus Pacebacteria bacterium]|nr:hypothetical protein [Candidatus Paceibacterota bacterium]
MIIELILSPIFWAINSALNLLPSVSLPDSFFVAFDSLFSLIATVGFFIPLDTIADALFVLTIYYTLKLSIHIFNFTLRKIPFIS